MGVFVVASSDVISVGGSEARDIKTIVNMTCFVLLHLHVSKLNLAIRLLAVHKRFIFRFVVKQNSDVFLRSRQAKIKHVVTDFQCKRQNKEMDHFENKYPRKLILTYCPRFTLKLSPFHPKIVPVSP